MPSPGLDLLNFISRHEHISEHILSGSRRYKTEMIMINHRLVLISLILGFVTFESVDSFHTSRVPSIRRTETISLHVTEEKGSAEETTEKFGLEVGLAQAAKEGDGESAKSLLKKYGIAYLATSIPLAIISFTLCYALVDNGVDVGSLLAQVGIEDTGMADKAGTVAIAYAAHKAASPIRFPPTVLLTPVVAKMIGKEPEEAN